MSFDLQDIDPNTLFRFNENEIDSLVNSIRTNDNNSNTGGLAPVSNSSTLTSTNNTSSQTNQAVSPNNEHVVVIDDNKEFIDLTKENNDDVLIIDSCSTSKPGRLPKKNLVTRPNIGNPNQNEDLNNGFVLVDEVSNTQNQTNRPDEADPNSTIIIDDEESSDWQAIQPRTSSIAQNNPTVITTSTLMTQITIPSIIPAKRKRTINQIVNSVQVAPSSSLSSNLVANFAQANPVAIQKQPGRLNSKILKANEASKQPPEPSSSIPSCPICLENLDELKTHNKRLMATLCGHVLCNSCLDEHFKRSSETSSSNKSILCPTCRTKLTKSKIHSLYL